MCSYFTAGPSVGVWCEYPEDKLNKQAQPCYDYIVVYTGKNQVVPCKGLRALYCLVCYCHSVTVSFISDGPGIFLKMAAHMMEWLSTNEIILEKEDERKEILQLLVTLGCSVITSLHRIKMLTVAGMWEICHRQLFSKNIKAIKIKL